jgi:hypothetical protein
MSMVTLVPASTAFPLNSYVGSAHEYGVMEDGEWRYAEREYKWLSNSEDTGEALWVEDGAIQLVTRAALEWAIYLSDVDRTHNKIGVVPNGTNLRKSSCFSKIQIVDLREVYKEKPKWDNWRWGRGYEESYKPGEQTLESQLARNISWKYAVLSSSVGKEDFLGTGYEVLNKLHRGHYECETGVLHLLNWKLKKDSKDSRSTELWASCRDDDNVVIAIQDTDTGFYRVHLNPGYWRPKD